ncbi:MAG TPA: DUF192 domain-containing protein [Thermoanaerobaculia bacterium]|nr:DUF192 domain-containing protein [Thermoanaerobaculia bacterium]
MSARLAAFPLGLALLACAPSGPGPAPATTAAPASPRVLLPSGAVIRVELAVTEAERAQGLMFRESLAEGAGMLFLFDGTEIRPFWMKNCHFPLDIVHLTKDGTVVDVLANVPPCAADPCPTYTPAAASDTVLELNAGVAARSGLLRGAKVRYVDVPGR